MQVDARSGTYRIRFAAWSYIWLAILAAGAFLLLDGKTALAHGADRVIRLDSAMAGPYQVTIWTAPGIFRTGEVHVGVIAYTANGAPITNALAKVTMSPVGAGPVGAGAVSSAEARGSMQTVAVPRPDLAPGEQEAAFVVEDPGTYVVEVTVVAPDGTTGKAEFDAEILSVPVAVKAAIHAQLVASLLVGLWLLKKGRRVWFPRRRDTEYENDQYQVDD